jgi:hypothetical protein
MNVNLKRLLNSGRCSLPHPAAEVLHVFPKDERLKVHVHHSFSERSYVPPLVIKVTLAGRVASVTILDRGVKAREVLKL